MFCPKHLRFSCPDLPTKWVQLMTITLQVSQHRHVLIGTYLEGARACPPSKYVMITAVTQWGGGGGLWLPPRAIYLCLPQLSTTLSSPDKSEWIDFIAPLHWTEEIWLEVFRLDVCGFFWGGGRNFILYYFKLLITPEFRNYNEGLGLTFLWLIRETRVR